MPIRIRLLLVVACAATIVALSGPAPAAAGSYAVHQCDHAAGNGLHDFRWQASGSPEIVQNAGSGCGEFGLAVRNGNAGAEQIYPSGGYGGWFAYAPAGTAFTHFSGSFGVLAGCCVNGLASYAEATQLATGAGARTYLFQGELGNDSWYAPSGLQGPVGRGWDSSSSGFAAQRVGFHLRCGPGFACFQTRTGDLRLRARTFDFTLRDDVAPTLGAPGGTLLSGGWASGTRTLTFTASDIGGGLTGIGASVDDGTALSSPSTCTVVGGRYARLQPCPLARSGAWAIDTATLPDGIRSVTVRASDAGGAVGQQTRTVAVDNHAPAAPSGLTAIGGSGWRRANGFAVRWTNPGHQHAPIVRARFTACPAAGSPCISGERAGDDVAAAGGIALPRAGEWAARVWLEDAAGNADPDSAAAPVRLRFDPDAPALRFASANPDAPARVVVDATDLSGIVAATIELRHRGATAWRALPTARQGSRLTAQIDDSRLARGAYELRARATDAAGNRALAYGPERTLPVRTPTRLRAAVERRASVSARRGSTIVVRGALRTEAGTPVAGRAVSVALHSRDRVVDLPAIWTDDAGRIVLLLRARRSATIRLRFAGDGRSLPSARRLAIRVPAPVTMRTPRRPAIGGTRVTFRGRVLGGSIPRHGKLVEIQAHFRGRWRTISAVRSTRAGHWRFAYAFNALGRPATYRLRARAPVEAGYPFEAGASKPVRVTVLRGE